MKTQLHITLDIPEDITLSEHDAAMIIAGKLWLEGHLSYGEAAKMAGISKREFIESLGKYGYPFTNITGNDLKDDLHVAEKWLSQNKP
jgi:predicted HTH domain antitoxin